MAGKWIRVSVAARQLGVSVWTVYSLAERGRLTYRRDEDTGSWRIDAGSVASYERSRTVPAQVLTPEIVEAVGRTPKTDESWRDYLNEPPRRRNLRRTNSQPVGGSR